MKSVLNFFIFPLLFFICSEVTGQISFRSSSQSFTTTDVLSISKPSGLAVGDLMILSISSRDGNNGINPASIPTGWIQIYENKFGAQNRRASIAAYKLATNSDVAQTVFSFNVSGSSGNAGDVSAGSIITFLGVDRTTPVEVVGSPSTSTNQNVNASAITTLSNNAAVVMIGITSGDDFRSWSNWSTTLPGSLTEIVDYAANNGVQDVTVASAWAIKAEAGSTGNGTVTLSGSETSTAIMISIKSGIENLPVTLSSFTAKQTTDNKVSLAWVTSSESVNKGFSIERQEEGSGKFQSLGFIASKAEGGNSQSMLAYSFKDVTAKNGTNMYRLVQEDLDGTKTYSEVRVVKLNGQSVSMVFPNPSNGAVNISKTADGKKMNIQVIDQFGKIISQVNNITDANYRMNISQSGVYTIKMTYPKTGEQSIQRIVVQK